MTLDDLLIYGDWLEENSIKNGLYKFFLNCLRIKLRRNNNYNNIDIDPFDFYILSHPTSADLIGNGLGDGDEYGNEYGNSCSYNFNDIYYKFRYIDGASVGYGKRYGHFDGDGYGYGFWYFNFDYNGGNGVSI